MIFYYLRMKGIEYGFQQKYTTTDPSFLTLFNTLYQRYLKQDLTIKDAARNGNIMAIIARGRWSLDVNGQKPTMYTCR